MLPEEYRSQHRSERGQTILLVAVSMVSLLAMAALAIDVVTLYVARTEVQRAADAAALVGAKAVADSGLTTLTSGDPNLPEAITLAQSMATAAVLALINVSPPINNQVAGSPPTLVGGAPTFSNFAANNSNPTVTVTLQQTNLPTFFARIFGQRSATTSASATAEAYNPANQANFNPITPRCVKPMLMANLDPTAAATGQPLIDPATGTVLANLATLAASKFYLRADCQGASCSTPLNVPMQNNVTPPDQLVQYVPASVTPTAADNCPACAGASNFEQGLACCNATTYSCGGTTANAGWDATTNPQHNGKSSIGATAGECLIHASDTGLGQGQDQLDYPSAWPNGPPRITAGTANPMSNQVVTTSSSIVTIPIIAPNDFTPPTSGPVTVFGFLQAFVNYVSDDPGHHGEINITVLNIVACSQTPNGNAPIVGGNGASTIPVRLITPP
jgi:hypothetical protein